MRDERPTVLLFRLGALPFVRATLLPSSPLDELYLHRPCWIFRDGADPESIFDALPEVPADREGRLHATAMLCDVERLLMSDEPLRRRLGHEGPDAANTAGYHTNATYNAVARYFGERFEVVHLHELVSLQETERDPDEESIARARIALRLDHPTRAVSANREKLFNDLADGGDPSGLGGRAPESMVKLFAGRRPSRFNAVDGRALTALVDRHDLLYAIEASLHLDDPLLDQHGVWRALLLARGVPERVVEGSAVARVTFGDTGNSRVCWLLGRATEDLPGFLQHHGYDEDLLEIVLHAAFVLWHEHAWRDMGDRLLRDHIAMLDLDRLARLSARIGRDFAIRLRWHEAALRAAFPDEPEDRFAALFWV